jgi:hypothetical protein
VTVAASTDSSTAARRRRVRAAVAAVAVAGVLTAFALSIVGDRRGLDGEVSRSFEAVAGDHDAGAAQLAPLRCVKTSLNFYDCSVSLSRGDDEPATVHYRLALRDDGCWTARLTAPVLASTRFDELSGCVND